MRSSLGRGLAALLLTLACVLVGIPPAPALAAGTCELEFVVETGGDGIRDDSLEIFRLGEKVVLFEERPAGFPLRPFHQGGTGDRGNAEFRWTGHLTVCATTADLAKGLSIEHISLADDYRADNWMLKSLTVVNRATGAVLAERTTPAGQDYLQYFLKNSDQMLTIPLDAGSEPDPPADPARRFCRLEISVTTGGDGIRDDSLEIFRLGEHVLLFDERPADLPPRPFHQDRTGDLGNFEYTWQARLPGCATATELAQGFGIEHINYADDIATDNWYLVSLRVVDRDTGIELLDLDTPPGAEFLHYFQKNSGQLYHTPDQDLDGDHLSDRIELNGIPRADGTVDTWLPDHGANPCRDTIAVEIDWLLDTGSGLGDRPDQAAIDEAIAMFANAPRQAEATCPYGFPRERGVQLLVHLDQQIPVSRAQREQPLAIAVGGQPQPFDSFRAAHFSPARSGLFFYNLWGYRTNNTNMGGWCCFGRDFVVTLGALRERPVRMQSGTFVHELGHALGLGHGGADRVNYKPNYLSVMNYTYSAVGLPDHSAWQARMADLGDATDGSILLRTLDEVSRLDYSDDKLPSLVRTRLDEGEDLGTDRHTMAAWWNNKGILHLGDASTPLDWDTDGEEDEQAVAVDVNGEFQRCVEGTDPDRDPPVDDELETDSSGDDLKQRGRIYAGLNGICETPPEPTDQAAFVPDTSIRVPMHFDYPHTFRYADELTGFDDWEHLRFDRAAGDEGGGPAPDVALEPTTDEMIGHRARLVDALVAAGSPRPASRPRWAYAYMDRATTAEAPIGATVPLTPSWQWSTGRLDPATADRRATVVHTGTGTYEVRLPGVASAAGIAHVTPYRTAYRGRTCGVTGYAPAGPDQVVKVRCFNEAGAPVDWWFTIFFAAPGPGTAPYATVRYDDGAGGTGSVNSVFNAGTVNSDGGVNRVTREGTGRYRVTLEGSAFASGTGYVQVTPYGDGAAARCVPAGSTPGADRVEITVACHTIGGTVPADSPWLLSYVDGAGLHRDGTTPAAYASVTGDPAAPVVDRERSFSGNGEVPALTRLGTGQYRLSWDTLGKTGDSVQVTATGTGGGYCHLGTIDSYSAPPRVSVHVWCHTAAGAPGDHTFAVAYLRAP
ncbi:hypothetical protein AB0J28_40620 [Streptosporangium canum]|uniref:hypothetical protein n=1 Tax=Streptosporangium canum TaxID=324952 RepID=UPI003444B559